MPTRDGTWTPGGGGGRGTLHRLPGGRKGEEDRSSGYEGARHQSPGNRMQVCISPRSSPFLHLSILRGWPPKRIIRQCGLRVLYAYLCRLSYFPPSRALSGQHPDLIKLLVSCSSLILINGSTEFEHTSSVQQSVHGIMRLMQEPATASAMQVGGLLTALSGTKTAFHVFTTCPYIFSVYCLIML